MPVPAARPVPIPVHGMVPTPFTPDARRVDHDSLAALAAALVRQGCTDLVALGVIAEPASLDAAEKSAVVATIRAAAPAAPLTAAVMTLDPRRRRAELRALAAGLRDGDRVMVPVSTPDPDGLRRALVEAHRTTGLPVVVQDYPAATGVHVAAGDLVRAVDGLEWVHAVKCEAPPTFWRIRTLRAATGVTAMAGPGGIGLVDDLHAGAGAVACGITRPDVLADAARLWAGGRRDDAAARIAAVSGLIGYETQQVTSIGIRKEHWRRRGVIASAAVRPPAVAFPAALAEHSERHGVPDRAAAERGRA